MTDARYYLAFFFYFLSLAFLFALLGGGISASHSIVKWLMLGGDQPLKTIEWLPGPLLSALLLTTLLPNFPVLKKIDEWLRKSFEKLGNIPQEVKSLCKGMYESEFIIPQELHDTIEQNLPGFSERDIRFVPDETLQYKWTKISSLYVQIIHWENLREEANEEAKKYREFVESQKKIYKMVTSRYEKVRSQAMNFFRCQSLGESIPYAVIEKCVINFREQVNELFNQLCVFIANGVLHCESTKIERKNKLRKMGFVDIIEKREPLNVNQAMTISVIVFLIMSAGMLIIGSLLGTKELFIHRVLVISIQVSIIYGFSVVASVYPKTVWKFANKEQVKYWPVVAYLLSGCIAVILAFIVGLTFRFIFIEHGDFLKALFDVRWKYPWFIMSFVVASVTAWLCDWFSPKEETEPRWSH